MTKKIPFNPNNARGTQHGLFADLDATKIDSMPKHSSSNSAKSSAETKSSTSAKSTDTAPMRVSQVAEIIETALAQYIPKRVNVIGEISNLSKRNHWYFSLKDDRAILKCVAWASKARLFQFDAQDGQEVVASGNIQFYGPQGQMQLYVDRLQPVGIGKLEMQFRELCHELRREGYFDVARKKPLPIFPKRICIITSESGAAIQDVLNTMKQRCPAVEIACFDVRVQGDCAAGEISDALEYIRKHHKKLGVDAILLTRGGGSIEDLKAFNERIVADALLDYPIPTVAAIGHETDTTIAELVADVRCATPTQAAMLLAPDRNELRVQVNHVYRQLQMHMTHVCERNQQLLHTYSNQLGDPQMIVSRLQQKMKYTLQQLNHATQQRVNRAHGKLRLLEIRLNKLRPHQIIARRERMVVIAAYRLHHALCDRFQQDHVQVETADDTLAEAIQNRLTHEADAIKSVGSLLQSVNPKRVLARGFTITRNADTGHMVKKVCDVSQGTKLETQLTDGTIKSNVV